MFIKILRLTLAIMSLMFFSDCFIGYLARSHWNLVMYCGKDTAKQTDHKLYLSISQPNVEHSTLLHLQERAAQSKHIPPPYHNRFMALFLGPPGWAGARRELLDFMVQGKINRGRHTDHPTGCHSIQTNQCPPPPSSPYFYRPDALPAAQPTASKHWRQLAHSD